MSMKISNDTITNQTHDLLTCSAVPQPTVPPHALGFYKADVNLQYILLKFKAQWLHGTGNLSSHARSPLDGELIVLNLNWVVF